MSEPRDRPERVGIAVWVRDGDLSLHRVHDMT